MNEQLQRYLRSLTHSPKTIIGAVSSGFNVPTSLLLGKDRHKSIARARFAGYLLMRRAGYSYPEIGRSFGGRDHTTAINGCKRAELMVATDSAFAVMISHIERSIGE